MDGSGGLGAVSFGISPALLLAIAVLIVVGIGWLAIKLIAMFKAGG
jgi:hypothetical protein